MTQGQAVIIPKYPTVSQGHVIDIMTYNSYNLQYYSFRIIGI